MSNIWAFKYFTKSSESDSNNSNVPILTPASSQNENSGFISVSKDTKITTINVVNDYNWTYSPKTARKEVPNIILTEKRLKTNALVSQLLYSYGAGTTGIEQIKQNISDTFGKNNSFVKALDYIAGLAQGAQQFTAEQLKANSVTSKIINKLSEVRDENPIMDSDLLKAYRNLYLTQNTGWRYILPYFDNYSNDAANSFGADGNLPTLGALRSISEGVASFNEAIAVLQNPLEFSFAERAKFYSYPEQGDEISFEFPLINTGSSTYEDVKKNWQLLFLLLYQNKPSRVNANVIEPPVLYQVEMPGQKFIPYAYMSRLAVDFKGSRRTLSMEIPIQDQVFSSSSRNAPTTNIPNNQVVSGISNLNSKKITTIVPDAYVVKISIKGLVADSRNFMAAALESDGIGDFASNIRIRDERTGAILSEGEDQEQLDLLQRD